MAARLHARLSLLGHREHEKSVSLRRLHQLHVEGGRKDFRHGVVPLLVIRVPDSLYCLRRFLFNRTHLHDLAQFARTGVRK